MSKKEWNNEFKKDRGWLKRLESRLKAVEEMLFPGKPERMTATEMMMHEYDEKRTEYLKSFETRLSKLEHPDKPNRCSKCGSAKVISWNEFTQQSLCVACIMGKPGCGCPKGYPHRCGRGKLTPDKPECKSSVEWAKIFNHKFKILDPDGWDRANFSKSWNELITEKEFNRRVTMSTIEGFCPDPVPPLNVRVAKALGKEIVLCGELGVPLSKPDPEAEVHWRIVFNMSDPPKNSRWLPGGKRYDVIPSYDTDRDLAMGALEGYAKINSLFVEIQYHCHQECYIVKLAGKTTSSYKSLSTAICEAIVKHSEGK